MINDKKSLRRECRAKRDAFGADFLVCASHRACEAIASLEAFGNADALLLYYPINNEISPLPLVDKALAQNKKVAFPVCDHTERRLIFKEIRSLSELRESRFGLFEPDASAPAIKMSERTLCIAPAFAFSRDGSRLGYGGGFYDRFMADFGGITVGITYATLLFDELPNEPHDKAVDMVASEDGVIYTKK